MTTPGGNDEGDGGSFQNVLEEAQLLMEGMGVEDEATSDVNLDDDDVDGDIRDIMDSIVIDGFAIDSDEEAEEKGGAERKREEPKTNQETAVTSENVGLSRESSVALHPLQEGLNSPPEQHSSNGQSLQAAPILASSGSASSPSLDVFRSKTSQFASNIATFAQKAASQVAAATAVPPTEPKTPIASSFHSIPTLELDNDTKTGLLASHVGDLLPGERVIVFLSNLLHVSDSSMNNYTVAKEDGMWCCCMTYFRILLFCTSKKEALLMPSDWNSSAWIPDTKPPSLLQMPLASMDRVEKSIYTTSSNQTLMGLVVHGKDNGRQLKFTTPSYTDTLKAYESLQTYAFPGRRNLGYLFAFESKRNDVMASVQEVGGAKAITLPPTRKRFDALTEFQRQFRNLQIWTCWTQMNSQYQLSPSYPSILVGPASLSEASQDCQRVIRGSANFRSEHRLPVLTWSNGIDGASMWRASQPKVGLQGNRNAADEMLLKHICESAMSANALREEKVDSLPYQALTALTGSADLEDWKLDPNCMLKILDLRPRSSAMANRTQGYGYENTSYYPGATIQFCSIGNIHAVRDSYQKMSALCLSKSVADVQFPQLVEETKWLSHVRLILAASWETAYWIHVHRLPVLIHCSHGWDRTSQVAVLAQLLLDPHYRTREGFSTLVEKDFLSFGHPFHTRCGHGEGRGDRSEGGGGSSDDGQMSPIFLQFLDCAYQIVAQYPECFEFNTKYLLLLSEHVYSCRFGTMLCDTEREREVIAGIRQRTHSLWEYLEERDDLVNKRFTSSGGILLMPLPSLLRNVSLWTDRHCMYGPKSTLRALPSYLKRSHDPNPHEQQSEIRTKEEFFDLSLSFHHSKLK